MQTIEIITASPDVLGGTPIFASTRVPVKNLTDYLEAGDTIDDFFRRFSFGVARAGHRRFGKGAGDFVELIKFRI